jgi:hypothetical protein
MVDERFGKWKEKLQSDLKKYIEKKFVVQNSPTHNKILNLLARGDRDSLSIVERILQSSKDTFLKRQAAEEAEKKRQEEQARKREAEASRPVKELFDKPGEARLSKDAIAALQESVRKSMKKFLEEKGGITPEGPGAKAPTSTSTTPPFCGKCGEPLIKNSKFCGKCGEKV